MYCLIDDFDIPVFAFWWINFTVAILVFMRITLWFADLLNENDKLRRTSKIMGLSTLGIIYIYCLFCYVRTLG
nr:MAG TPA: hypothetical protein [Caudoviricetes sp.]